jgi:hypothetical protein
VADLSALQQQFSPALAANALANVVQMYSSMLIDAERREKILLAQIAVLQSKHNAALKKLKEHGIVLEEPTNKE